MAEMRIVYTVLAEKSEEILRCLGGQEMLLLKWILQGVRWNVATYFSGI
jgi:hypothetical protein